MSLNIRASLAAATPHANGAEWSEMHFPQKHGPMIRKGMRAWGNYDLTYRDNAPVVVWPPVKEA